MWRSRFDRDDPDMTITEGIANSAEVKQPPVLLESGGFMKTVFRNSVWSTFAVIASPILQFLFGGLTLRYVGVEAAGFSLSVGAVLGIAARFGTFGIGEAALPTIAAALGAHDERRVRGLVGVVLAVFGLSSVATAVAFWTLSGQFVEWAKSPVDSATAATFIAIACVSHVFGQLSLAVSTILRAAKRYDLVTAVTTPLTLVSGVAACSLIPVFPSLMTVAAIGVASASLGLLAGLVAVSRAVPMASRPLLALTELPALARYGFWISLTHAFGSLTGGVDDLVITGTCGAAAVPPWAIGKRLWLTAHTFLAQHTEHLIPTLGSLRQAARDTADVMTMAMHWYVMVVAAAGYTLMASCGDVIVGVVAGGDVEGLCKPAVYAYSLLGIAYALLIIPVIVAMAAGASRPAFIVALLSNTAQIAAVFWLASRYGAPAVYYAPVAALPLLLLATGTTATRIFDAHAAWRRLRPVLVPSIMGLAGIAASMAISNCGFSALQRLAAGGSLAAGVVAATFVTERSLSINPVFHRQLVRVLWHAFESTAGSVYRISEAIKRRDRVKPEEVPS
jgi:O-antigen/teichoic acid export membrane protein